MLLQTVSNVDIGGDVYKLAGRSITKAFLVTICFLMTSMIMLRSIFSASSPRPLPVNLWEALLDDCCVLHNSRFGSLALAALTGGSSYDHRDQLIQSSGLNLTIDPTYFPSEEARRFFQDYRIMLALEYRAEVSTRVAERKLGDETIVTPFWTSSEETNSLEFNVVNVMQPLIKLQAKFNPGREMKR